MHSWDLGGGFLSSGPNGNSFDLEPSVHGPSPTQLGHSSISPQQQINLMNGPEKDHHHSHSVPQGLIMKVNNRGNMSDEDEPSFEDLAKGKKGCPWQRMKWSDEVVRLLIAVVAHVGDDGALEVIEGLKRKSGYLQKKGKWKTISKIMIKRGCHVSPQQCEDKFNDLNKRYKRLNDILGSGLSCRVVENPSLMDSMPQLSSKAKDDVRKILGSKHLFYQEICAYHNGQRIPNCPDLNLQEVSANVEKENSGEAEANDDHDHDDDDDEDEDDDHDDDSDSDNEHDDNTDELNVEKVQDCNFELQMAGKSGLEKREWIRMQKLQLQERKLQIQAQSFELEKQRFKWMRYSSKKQREMERLRLVNERMNLENERMELQLTQKELEIGSKSSSEPSSSRAIERIQGRGRDPSSPR